MAIALHHSRATGTAKLVLIGIANHDGDGGAWPSVDTLAKYAGVHRRNVQKALQRLEELREISVVRNGGGDHSLADTHRPNLYRVTLRCPPTCDRTQQHRTSRKAVIDLFTPGVAVAPPGGESVTSGVAVAPPEPSSKPSIPDREISHSTRARECPVSARVSPSGMHSLTDLGLCVNCGTDLRVEVSA